MLNLITYWRRNFKKSSAKEVYILWCKSCNRKTDNKVCEVCGEATVEDIPVEIYWCKSCNVPVIQLGSDLSKTCPHCKNKLKYLSTDLRPVFPEERLLLEIIKKTPLKYK